jgi:SAM-dependent methyltransferase
MGFSLHSTRFLVDCWQRGMRFERVLTLGRQHLEVGVERLEGLLKQVEAWPPPRGEAAFREEFAKSTWRFEILLRALGARTVTVCDASDYEGAGLVHDLNRPIPPDWEAGYDLVVDGGTLEHVFAFPTAIDNCMRWLRQGGHFLAITPANNFFGHGFYQFSPELFFRVFSSDNGFAVEQVVATADAAGVSSVFGVGYTWPVVGPWFEVRDPKTVGGRVTLINARSTLLYVLARKTEPDGCLRHMPQQSDYQETWKQGEATSYLSAGLTRSRLLGWLLRVLGDSTCREWLPRVAAILDPLRWVRFRRQHSFANRRFFRRVKPLSGQPGMALERSDRS